MTVVAYWYLTSPDIFRILRTLQNPAKEDAPTTEMLSNKENIADVQVQQIPPKASPRDSSKEEGMRVQSEDDSVHAGTQVPLGTRNTCVREFAKCTQ